MSAPNTNAPAPTGYGKVYAALGGAPIGASLGVLVSGICSYDWPALFPAGGTMEEAVQAVVQGLVTAGAVFLTPHNFGGG